MLRPQHCILNPPTGFICSDNKRAFMDSTAREHLNAAITRTKLVFISGRLTTAVAAATADLHRHYRQGWTRTGIAVCVCVCVCVWVFGWVGVQLCACI